MPLRSYFLIIGPALAGFLWWVGWYLEPAPPPSATAQRAVVVGPSKATAASAGTAIHAPATPASGMPALPVASTTTAAAPQPATPAKDTATAEATPATDVTATTDTTDKRASQSAKHKKKVARKRPRRENYGPAYAERSPYQPYSSPYTYGYAPQQTYGYRSW